MYVVIFTTISHPHKIFYWFHDKNDQDELFYKLKV